MVFARRLSVDYLQRYQNCCQVHCSLGEVESRNGEQLVFALLEDYRAQFGYIIAATCVTGGPKSKFKSPDKHGKYRSDDDVEWRQFVREEAPGLANYEGDHH